MQDYVDPRITPASEYPIKSAYREKLSKEEIYKRLDKVKKDELIELVLWQGKATKVELIVIEPQKEDLIVQSKHGRCLLPKAKLFAGTVVGCPSLHRGEDKLGLVEYVLREHEIPENKDPSEATAGYNL